ncbi:MAG: hypothetical protein V4580_03345 [Bacteroidota bacterium]
MKATERSLLDMKQNILVFALANLGVYLLIFFIMRALGLLHISGLRMVNYIPLTFLCCYQVKHMALKTKEYLPFLQAFLLAIITGTASFVFFAVFIFIYSKLDPYFASLYFSDPNGSLRLTPFIVLFFEGSAGSIIVGLIVAMYSDKNA